MFSLICAILAVASVPQVVQSGNVACQQIRYVYSAKGMNVYDVPLTPQSGSSLQICPQGPTCCTPDMEERLGHWSASQYKEAVSKKTSQMAAPFLTKATKMDDFMEQLFVDSQKQFDDIFTRTYGVLYERNAFVFREYFRELRHYYQRGRTNLAEATATFFTTLYQKMFQVMNAQYNFDNSYLMCVAEHMDDMAPFGDVPRKMASAVKRSMVAARALLKAVQSAYEIAHQMKNLPPSSECLKAVQKMNSCPACQGYTKLKPCSNYCINVMKGCLVYHIELQDAWDKFIDSLISLTERLTGPFNVEMIVLPLDIQISDAIMHFQDTGFKVTQRVFEVCGTPRLIKRNAEETPAELGILKAGPSTSARKSDFDKLVSDLRQIGRDTQGFWRHLPYVMCDQPNPAFQERLFGIEEAPAASQTAAEDTCWNGKDSGLYEAPVVPDGLNNQLQNPEVAINSPVTPTILKEQLFRLQSITNQLKLAHKGQDIEWWDEESDFDDLEMNDGSGSGDYLDEQYDDFSGSGDEEMTNSQLPEVPWMPWDTEETNEEDNIPTAATTTTTTEKPKVDSGATTIKTKWHVAKYLLVVGVCWLSTLLTEWR